MIASVLFVWSVFAVVCPTALLSIALGLALHRARARRDARGAGDTPRVTGPAVHLVRPLCGREEGADHKNRSLLRQQYAPLTVMFVAESELDPGLSDARLLCAGERDATCISATSADAVSRKASNMISGWRSSSSELVGFCDSDIALAPEDIGRCVTAMQARGAAASFAPCLFDADGVWGKLAMQIATVDKLALAEGAAALGYVPYLEGGLMLVSRAALDEAGGIDVIAGTIADDLRIGRVLRAHGFRLGISSVPIVHRTAAEPAHVWAHRYLRWAVCRRSEAPCFQLLTLVLHPILVPLAIAIAYADARVGMLLAAGILWRIAYAHAASRLILAPHGVRLNGWCWARPITEILDAAFVGAAFVIRSFTWRGCAYDIDFRGRVMRTERRVATTAAPLQGARSCE